jgi:hypothetical protein
MERQGEKQKDQVPKDTAQGIGVILAHTLIGQSKSHDQAHPLLPGEGHMYCVLSTNIRVNNHKNH